METAYLRLYRTLRGQIVQGDYPYDSRLPSKRVLAENYHLSLATVQHAYEILCDEGYAVARERSGYFVAYRPTEVMGERMELMPPQGMQHSNHTFHTAEELPFTVYARTMRRVLAEYGDRLLVKSPNTGCGELREAVSRYLAVHRGILVPPARIVIGSGAEQLYGLIVQVLGRERRYALEDPCYERIRQVYQAQGVQVEQLRMGPDGIRTEALEQSSAEVLHITPFHSWPTGITASASKRREYLHWANARRGFIVEDDFDSEFSASTKTEDTLFSQSTGNVIYVNTFSKTVAPSIRAGYMLLPEALMEVYRQRAGFSSCTVPVAEQLLLAELIRSGDFVRHINRIRRRRRQQERLRNHSERSV